MVARVMIAPQVDGFLRKPLANGTANLATHYNGYNYRGCLNQNYREEAKCRFAKIIGAQAQGGFMNKTAN